jgi:hypothetical protein
VPLLKGQYGIFKVVLEDKSDHPSGLSFEQEITTKPGAEFAAYSLALRDFACVFRGKPCGAVLQLNAIETVGLQAAGLFFSGVKQRGAAALEVLNITLS